MFCSPVTQAKRCLQLSDFGGSIFSYNSVCDIKYPSMIYRCDEERERERERERRGTVL